ncbi:hypothetical protein M422DRAFT_265101 [Sphaerobolus stellatus SS14]|uniref:Uncharacterized protein n=1 Tax=Sphaerobolus stellatus (strain SS14) TaxID=990650 RepID=A0A0C9TS49_SPHS4|nr:hypothetical protein M422DRAFT_265101 [Sphaerobolus stellatus SS14]
MQSRMKPSEVGRWDQLIAGRWKRNDSPFLCSPAPARLQCWGHSQPCLRKLEPYFVCHATKLIWNDVNLCSQLQANKIASLKGGIMNPFRVHDDLLLLVWGSPFYIVPNVGDPMDQDEPDPEHTSSQPTAGSSSLADRLDYGEDGFFSCPPVDVQDLRERTSYFESTSTEELTHDLYADKVE